MGFKRKVTTFPLDFTGSDFEGLEVICRRPSLAAMAFAAEHQGIEMTPAVFKDLLQHFADGLVSWNLEDDDDQPVPATFEVLVDLDDEFLAGLFDAWYPAITGVPAPLGDGSSSGDPSLEESIQMEPLSASQAS
jgi:hypothetical protein